MLCRVFARIFMGIYRINFQFTSAYVGLHAHGENSDLRAIMGYARRNLMSPNTDVGVAAQPNDCKRF